jgi:hypothetical protein
MGAYKEAIEKFAQGIDTEVIPTPRSLVRLFNSPKNLTGSFRAFSDKFSGNEAYNTGRTSEVVCSEYLYTVIQALRWEAGHSYWQFLRSFPDGFRSREEALKTLFYGWNLRKRERGDLIDGPDLEKFTKYLIFLHLLRNELTTAPQLTEMQQRFTASEQTRNFTESFVRSQGSRSKYGELYNWAVMMPHVQGILTYVILIGYPFAAMLMVIPGYWKAFFTWVTFFAWVKLWDVGFAIVHTLERSVWATLGNRSSIASVAGRLLQVATDNQYDITTECTGGAAGAPGAGVIANCTIPEVKESQNIEAWQAWSLLDQALVLSGAVDLDLANGYYIYIMSALYFAVPAVTGQLVLGAKSGLGSLATQAISQSAGEAGSAAKSGVVGEVTNRMAANKQAITQTSMAKSDRQSGLALEQLEMANRGSNAEIEGSRINAMSSGMGARAEARDLKGKSFSANFEGWKAVAAFVAAPFKNAEGVNGGAEGAPGNAGTVVGALQSYGPRAAATAGAYMNMGYAHQGMAYSQQALHGAADAKAFGTDANWMGSRARLYGQGYNGHAQRLQSQREFERDSASYDATARFASDIAGLGGVAGYNPGGLIDRKPTDAMGMAMTGQLGGDARTAARYLNEGYRRNVSTMTGLGMQFNGGARALHEWGGGTTYSDSLGTAFFMGARGTGETIKAIPSNLGSLGRAFKTGLEATSAPFLLGPALPTTPLLINNILNGTSSHATSPYTGRSEGVSSPTTSTSPAGTPPANPPKPQPSSGSSNTGNSPSPTSLASNAQPSPQLTSPARQAQSLAFNPKADTKGRA